jgi:hypothetical protein
MEGVTMEVLSPVGRFPLKLRSASLASGRVKLRADLGAWRSEVFLGREDLPLVGGCVGCVAAAFVLGRVSARRAG